MPRRPKEDIPRYWSVCDAALVHLKNDPVFRTVIPSKIFESMAMGLPILFAGPHGQGSEIVRSEAAGIVVRGGDPTELAAAARRLAGQPELTARLARASAGAAPKYSRDAQAERTLESLRRAVGVPAVETAPPPTAGS